MSGMLPPQGPPPGMMPPPMPGAMMPPGGPVLPAGGMPADALQLKAGPPPLPQMPGLMQPMRPTGSVLNADQVLANLIRAPERTPDDSDEGLPDALRAYAAGLRPTPRPDGADWQQEIIYERLGKTDQQVQAIARRLLQDAQDYNGGLSGQRQEASRYYNGEAFGDEQKGRSQIVMTTVRDTIRSMLPSLLRVFTAVEDPISFEPASHEILGNDKLATMLSRQATDYCRWALFSANKGWQILHDALLDALTRKAGWVRWHWGARKDIRIEVCEGLLQPQLQLLLSEPGIEAQRIVRRPMTQAELQNMQKTPDGMMYLQQGGPPEYWSVTITRSAQQAWPVMEVVPPECVWVVADATTVESARAIFQVRHVVVSDLIEMGLPEDKVLAAGSSDIQPQQRLEAIARSPARGQALRFDTAKDRSMRNVRYAEGWIRTDADNDNRAELLHVHMLGDSNTLVQWERTDEIPLACFTPYREPSQLVGNSVADMVMDLQRVESRVMRAVLDSLGQAMFPRTAVVLGQANLADVRQTAIGSIIRVAQQGAVQELVKPFAGKEALPVMQVLEGIRESRTGITRASQGLTVDELQSTAPIAVSQQSSAAQDRLDMVARTLAETGLAPLYTGLLKMMARQQDRPNVIRIRGQWISIDPRALATMWETSVNVGGKGMPHERMALLAQIAQKQEQIVQMGGLDNPLCGIPEYRNTLARMLETASISDVSSYFKALPPGFQPPPAQPQPSAEQLLAEVQKQKTAADVETDRAKAQTDRAKLLLEDDRERDKAALDAWSKTWIAAAQFGTPAPSLDEFRTAMKNDAPAVGLLANLPPPTSPQPPATGGPPQAAPKPGGQPPMMPPQQGQGRPMAQPQGPQMAPPQRGPDPATQAAVRGALMSGNMPTSYGQIAQRAMLSPLMGAGGPPMPPGAGGAPP
jgi:hypothetical protein